MLSHLLHLEGIDSVVLEARSRDYVEHRVRAGVLEQGTVDLLDQAGVGERCAREGMVHKGCYISIEDERHEINFEELTGGKHVVVYGQTEVTKDLINARLACGGDLRFECDDVAIHDIESDKPRLTYTSKGEPHEVVCDFIAGCDGFHGVARQAMPASLLRVYERVYPFGWLGILAEAPPVADELIYARHSRGFALYSMRSPAISRLYLQVPAGEDVAAWPDERIWAELQHRLAAPGWRVGEGPVLEKGITPMRSFVCEPLRHGNLFLAGDAAHIVPPTGAKGLNLAVNDVRLLAAALIDGSDAALDAYSANALRRVWRAQDFSNHMTRLLHDLGEGPFAQRMQLARLEYLDRSEAARRSLAENYAGLEATADF